MKALSIIKFVFSSLGALFLAIGFLWAFNSYQFSRHAQKANGIVLEVIQQESSSSSNGRRTFSISYYPIVEFATTDGKKYKFKSSTGSYPSAYQVGELVPVLYDAQNPTNASLAGFLEYYLGPMIFAGIGFVFFAIGGGMIFYGIAQKRKKEFLLSQGYVVQAKFQEVTMNRSVSVNGRHPFLILAQWQNPQSSQIHIFKSENLWFDPLKFIKTEEMKVYIAPNNPKKYYMDISFLPTLA